MKFVQIGERLINLDNVTDITVREDRVGIKEMAIHLRERRIRLSPEETKGFERWLRTNKLIEEIKPSMVRYPTMDEIVRKMEAKKN